MADELQQANPIYLPSKFWTDLNAINKAQLADAGFENFKRTINQNYFNWAPSSFEDNQLRNLLGLWISNPSPTPVLATLEGDYRLINMFNKNMLDTSDKARIYAFFVGLLWWFASRDDVERLTFRLSEPIAGNPIRITLGSRIISQDLANSIREYSTIRNFAQVNNQIVAEIGAGYGRLAYVFLMASKCKYLIFDVPPALYVSERYLSSVLPDRRLFHFRSFAKFSDIEAELATADFGFFTPNQLELFPPGYFDISLSVSALHEMRSEQIANFLSMISKLTTRLVYLKNWRNWHNTIDNVRIDEATFQLSDPWETVLTRVDLVQDLFAERVFARRA